MAEDDDDLNDFKLPPHTNEDADAWQGDARGSGAAPGGRQQPKVEAEEVKRQERTRPAKAGQGCS